MESPSTIQPELRQLAARLAMTEFVDPTSPLFEKKLDLLWNELQESLGAAMAREQSRREKVRPTQLVQLSRPSSKAASA